MPRTLPSLLLVAAILRVALALCSIGTNDAMLWQHFAMVVDRGGLWQAWQNDPWINHPPLPLAWAYLCHLFVGPWTYGFSVMLKLPAIAGDLIVIRLLWQLATERGASPGQAWMLAALFALNPIAILLSAYHGNTDSLMAALVLCAFRFAQRGQLGYAGLLLGAAINIKLVPLPCVIVLFGCARSFRPLLKAFAGLGVATLPFIPALILSFDAFTKNVLSYLPIFSAWGITVPTLIDSSNLHWQTIAAWIRGLHVETMRFVIFALAFGLAWLGYRRSASPLVLAAAFMCGLVAWSSAAPQYLIWPLPLLAALRPRLAVVYGLTGGLYLGWRYVETFTGTFPLISYFTLDENPISMWIGLLPWAVLAYATFSLARQAVHVRPAVATPHGVEAAANTGVERAAEAISSGPTSANDEQAAREHGQ